MMIQIRLLTAEVTILAVAFYFFTAFNVGRLRAKHAIKAPACSGHPEFDRAYRVQMNTLEQLAIFLPLLWICVLYPISPALLAPLVGLVWVAARVIYMISYLADPEKRRLGAGLGGLCDLILLILAIAGVVNAWQAIHVI
jgi:glutathione S-transferase